MNSEEACLIIMCHSLWSGWAPWFSWSLLQAFDWRKWGRETPLCSSLESVGDGYVTTACRPQASPKGWQRHLGLAVCKDWMVILIIMLLWIYPSMLWLLFYFSHYFVHGGFFDSETWIFDNVDKIRHIPCTIVQGRYDVVCPATTAWNLHKVSGFN